MINSVLIFGVTVYFQKKSTDVLKYSLPKQTVRYRGYETNPFFLCFKKNYARNIYEENAIFKKPNI